MIQAPVFFITSLLTIPYMMLDDDWVGYVNTPMKEGELHKQTSPIRTRTMAVGDRYIWYAINIEKQRET